MYIHLALQNAYATMSSEAGDWDTVQWVGIMTAAQSQQEL